MTTPTQEIARRLRNMLAARVPVFTTEQGRQVFAVYGAAEAMLVLHYAADALEAQAMPVPAQPSEAMKLLGEASELGEQVLAVCNEQSTMVKREQVRRVALDELEDWRGAEKSSGDIASVAIKVLCKRLGVEL